MLNIDREFFPAVVVTLKNLLGKNDHEFAVSEPSKEMARLVFLQTAVALQKNAGADFDSLWKESMSSLSRYPSKHEAKRIVTRYAVRVKRSGVRAPALSQLALIARRLACAVAVVLTLQLTEADDIHADDTIAAMRSELEFSLANLRLDDNAPPYFLLYRLSTVVQYSLHCQHGSVSAVYERSSQVPFVEARVGSYDLDNTWEGFATGRSTIGGSLAAQPDAIRQVFWSLSDEAYKNALRKYLDKKAKLAIEAQVDKLPDFSREDGLMRTQTQRVVPIVDKARLESLCKEASALFRSEPEVDFSLVTMSFDRDLRYLVSSEGMQGIQDANATPLSLHIRAEARAPDGLAVSSFRSMRVNDFAALPNGEGLKSMVRELAGEVAALKKAPLGEPETGPALLDSESTGVFFHEALGHRLEGLRQRESGQLQTFRNKVGQRIIPAFLSVESDASLVDFNGVALSGHYTYDSEGVASRKVVLVEKGVLKDFLLSRRP
ncbi:MAG: metallopeptidase TldD-related protein, partial [Elusimicrobiota bacterium]